MTLAKALYRIKASHFEKLFQVWAANLGLYPFVLLLVGFDVYVAILPPWYTVDIQGLQPRAWIVDTWRTRVLIL